MKQLFTLVGQSEGGRFTTVWSDAVACTLKVHTFRSPGSCVLLEHLFFRVFFLCLREKFLLFPDRVSPSSDGPGTVFVTVAGLELPILLAPSAGIQLCTRLICSVMLFL